MRRALIAGVAALCGAAALYSPPELRSHGDSPLCSLRGGPEFSAARTRDIVEQSEAIVRATVLGTTPAPAGSKRPDLPYLAFRVDEVLRGREIPDTLRFSGVLEERDSFRPEGENRIPYLSYYRWRGGGDCGAYTYQTGGQFLLLLGRTHHTGDFDPYWALLAPTNEQIRGAADPWAGWVRRVIKTGSEHKAH